MGKESESYRLHRVINAGRIILDLKKGFEKDALFYRALEHELLQDWELKDKHAHLRDKSFKIGEHVLVKIAKERCHRAIFLNSATSTSYDQEKRTYSVFLYDYGEFQDVCAEQVARLRPDRIDALPARTIIVQLMGVVPGKVVLDLAKKMTGDEAQILTQDSEWSRKANKLATEWLNDLNVRYLNVRSVRKNSDGTVYGDIWRKLNPIKDKTLDAALPKRSFESLIQWLVDNHVGLENESLLNSQLKIPDENFKDATQTRSFRKRRSRETKEVQGQTSKLAATVESLRTLDNTVDIIASQLSEPEHTDPDLDCNDCIESEGLEEKFNKLEVTEVEDKKIDDGDDGVEKDSEYSDTYSVSSLSSGSTVSSISEERAQLNGYNIPGRLLLRGLKTRPPYSSLKQFSLPNPIVQAMATLKIQDLTALQKTACANFMRAVDLIMVAPPDSGGRLGKHGRLLCYILPIIRLVYEKYSNLTSYDIRNCSPEAIIIVNSFNTGKGFENFIDSLFSYCPQLPLRVKFISKDIPDDPVSRSFFERKMLPKGINILITTVDYLDALLQTKHGADLCDNLRYIIFEELDLYMKNFWDDIVLFIGGLRQNIRCTGRESFQLAFSASRWSPEMEPLYKLMFQDRAPVIVINSVNQVLRYAKVNWVVHHIEAKEDLDDAKLSKLIELLQSNQEAKTVVACCSPAVAKLVCKGILEETMISAQHISNRSHQHSLQYAMKLWKSKKLRVLVISDDLIGTIDVADATCLICYDTPIRQIVNGQLRPVTAERFGYLWSNVRQIEKEGEGNPSAFLDQPEQPLSAHFLVTGNEFNFYMMYKFAMSLEPGVTYPVKLKEKALKMERDGSCGAKLCEGIKTFGYCNLRDPTFCSSLHDFTTKDLTTEHVVPRTGEIEVRVKRSSSPSLHKVQLLRHFAFEKGKRICTHSYIKELRDRHQIMKKIYEPEGEEAETGVGDSSERNRKEILESFEIGTPCVAYHPDKMYVRARITNVSYNDRKEPTHVRVFCIDVGDHLNPAANKIYKLPAEFQLWKPLVVDLILCCLKPPRREQDYRSYTEGNTQAMLADKIFNAKIWISVGNTVWVNPLIEFHLDPVTKKPFKGMSARLQLITKRLAVFNGQHLKTLISLLMKHKDIYKEVSEISQQAYVVASKESIPSDELEMAKEQFFQLGDDYRWAFVEKNTDTRFSTTSISVMFGYNPWRFYGVLDKFQPELKQLEKELHSTIENMISGEAESKTKANAEIAQDDKDCSIFADYEGIFKNFYEPELVVAVKEKVEQRWMRAIILSRYESDCGPLFEVFFVDYGDVLEDVPLKDMFPLPNKFVNRIPFQVIAFKLDHIKPVEPLEREDQDQVWNQSAKDAFLDLVLPDSLSELLDVVALEYLNEHDQHFDPQVPCRHYSCIAFHRDGDDLGSMLVAQGQAAWKPGKAEFVAGIKDKFLAQFNATVNQHLPLDEDDDGDIAPANMFDFNGGQNFALEDDGEFDINMDQDAINLMLQDMLGGRKNGIIKIDQHSNPLSSQQAITGDESANGEGEGDVPALPGSSSNSGGSGEQKPAQTSTRNQPNIVDGEHLLHPKICWRQTETDVTLTIILPDIKEFSFKVSLDRKTITFRTLNQIRDYGFSLQLYGRILTEYQTYLTGQYLRITVKKRMSGLEWPRILFDPAEKNIFLTMDLAYLSYDDDDGDGDDPSNAHFSDTDDDDPEALIQSLKDKRRGTARDLGDSDDDDDDVPGGNNEYVGVGGGRIIG